MSEAELLRARQDRQATVTVCERLAMHSAGRGFIESAEFWQNHAIIADARRELIDRTLQRMQGAR